MAGVYVGVVAVDENVGRDATKRGGKKVEGPEGAVGRRPCGIRAAVEAMD